MWSSEGCWGQELPVAPLPGWGLLPAGSRAGALPLASRAPCGQPARACPERCGAALGVLGGGELATPAAVLASLHRAA